jgi:hypothetical protein
MATPGTGGFWQRMTPRERSYIMALVATFFVVSALVLFYLRSNTLHETQREIDDLKLALDAMNTRGAVYQARLEEKKERESSISSEVLEFASLLDEARTTVENMPISNEEEPPSLELGGGLIKRTYKLDLRNVTLGDVTKLLQTVENKQGHIILTEGLLVRSPSASEDRLNIDVTLATWERRSDVATAAEEGGEGRP